MNAERTIRRAPRSRSGWLRGLASALLLAAAALPAAAVQYKVVAWNDLGMHCMDADYGVFSILPPYNNLHAQVVDVSNNKLVAGTLAVTFESTPDLNGSVNSWSVGKTNFWDYAQPLFGVTLPPGVGLTGLATANPLPQPLAFDAPNALYQAQGIPITPFDDTLVRNTYPMVRVVARDASTGSELASAHVVLPVSDEMTCVACHASGSSAAAKPAAGWVNDPRGPEKDYRRNILALHDDRQGGTRKFKRALSTLGYLPQGLLATSDGGRPILCAACHASNALPGTGLSGVSALTSATHTLHAKVADPATGQLLGDESNRSACYMCHPGSQTKCLRGVMGNATDASGNPSIECQSCHSTMTKVGSARRTGWLQQPTCQACHHDSQRDLTAVDSRGNVKKPADTRFATNPDVPSAGFNLYRFSKGHGGLQCEACHGSTHAEYTSSYAGDNVLSTEVQGHAGTISECSACHTALPVTATGGPHGLHTFGSAWVGRHGDVAEGNRQACAYCHGADFRGSPLSTTKQARSFVVEGRPVNYAAGQPVTCYDCHAGPGGGGLRATARR